MGIVCEDCATGDPLVPEQSIYINPEDGFDQFCVNVHGITAQRVSCERTFPEVWKDVESCFTNAVIIGHNVASADLNALVKNLVRYNIDIPEMHFIDTLEMAKEIIPDNRINDYSLGSLCAYYDIEIDNAHDAFDDACACKDLFTKLSRNSLRDVESFVTRYVPQSDSEFKAYVSDPQIRRAITDYYGIVKGIMADNEIDDSEKEFLMKWKKDNAAIISVPQVSRLVNYIDEALSDGILTEAEKNEINFIVADYYSSIKAAPETTATQILDGILKGISADSKVNEKECRRLQSWLYDNSFLEGHFPYDKMLSLIEKVLEDNYVSTEESKLLKKEIGSILNPVEELRTSVCSLCGKTICLSGNFSHGQKADVAAYIISKGGTVEENVKKTTDILVVGDLDCDAYAHGTYGTKVKKAIELNNKGKNISIIKESDLYNME